MHNSNTLEKVFAMYYPALCYYANRLVGDQLAAEDLVEDTFIKLWEKQPDFTRYLNVRSLLYSCVRNACMDFIRHRKYIQSKEQFIPVGDMVEWEDLAVREITRAELIRKAQAALQSLPPECRKVMYLYFSTGLDHKEISRRLGISVSTVKNQKARGIRLIRERMGDSFFLLFFLKIL